MSGKMLKTGIVVAIVLIVALVALFLLGGFAI